MFVFFPLLRRVLVLSLAASFFPWFAVAQSDTATLSGRVLDPSGLAIVGARVELVDLEHDITSRALTNSAGLYGFSSVRSGHYRMSVSASGFRAVNLAGLSVNIQDNLEQNFKLAVGSATESVTVEAKGSTVDVSTSVSTVVDHQFVKELPLNGRSFQTLFQLTPGVVVTTSTYAEQGQFSVNGQRANANYFQVDGVSANVGIAAANSPGQSTGGSLPALTATGGTNGLVATDALEEFVLQTSGYAPEYGRTPGAQVGITTRSGTNELHGDVFEYLRNDLFDANNWFANHNKLKRPALRQNDFGGVLGGPVIKNRTFFFLSYEGLRLRQPNVALTDVPSLAIRKSAPAAILPFLNAFPLPTGTEKGNGLAPANYSFSNPSDLNAGSIRVDQHLNQRVNLFARYNYSSSFFKQRGGLSTSLATQEYVPFELQTLTAGASWIVSPRLANDLRFNRSWVSGSSSFVNDTLGGAVPLNLAQLLPADQDPTTSEFGYQITSGAQTALMYGRNAANLQRQLNLVDTLSWQKGSHFIKGGFDYRRLTPEENSGSYFQLASFNTGAAAASGSLALAAIGASASPVKITYANYSAFLQDSWKPIIRLSVTYGIRWDYNPAPSGFTANGLLPVTLVGTDLTKMFLAPPGAPIYHSTANNLAPRLGLAYNIHDSSNHALLVRTGFGIFYDLGNGLTGNVFNGSPFTKTVVSFPSTFPLSSAASAPPQVSSNPPYSHLWAFPDTVRQPYTYHWNLSLEQALGSHQSATVSYLGAGGHSLPRQDSVQGPILPANYQFVSIVNQQGYSKYDALQVQFKKTHSVGLDILGAYTYAHSRDNVSADTIVNPYSVRFNPGLDYSSSDFDIRHTGSVAIDWEPKVHSDSRWRNALWSHWGANTLIVARSAPPVNVQISENLGFGTSIFRPDRVAGVPLYLSVPSSPGGVQINPAAFQLPQSGSQGTLGRNSLRGFSLFQQDVSIRRYFHLTDKFQLQARVEAFNILNHPNFAPPSSVLGSVSRSTLIPRSTFGVSQGMFASGVSPGGFGAGFNPLYQLGGSRSMQIALKLEF